MKLHFPPIDLLISLSFLIFFPAIPGHPSTSSTGSKANFSHPFSQSSETRNIRLPKPVDWITGKVPEFASDFMSSEVHAAFFERSKFNFLSRASLTKLEKDLRVRLDQKVGPVEFAVMNFELATVIAQNAPTTRDANQINRILEAKHRLKGVLKNGLLPPALVKPAQDVLRFLREISQEKEKSNLKIRQINWAISNRCLYCCVGCYFNFRESGMTASQTEAVALKLRAAGVREVILTGGDPLLAGLDQTKTETTIKADSGLSKPFLEQVELLNSLGLRVAVDTTAYTLTRDIAERLVGKVAYVGIPLDGTSQEVLGKFRKGQTDIFERTVASIRLLKSLGIPVKINTTVTQHNIHNLFELARFLDQNEFIADWGWSVFQ